MKKYIHLILSALLVGGFVSCDDFLDREPLSAISPETYFANVSQLQAYVDNYYADVLPSNSGNSYGIFSSDQGTDNQIAATAPSRHVAGEWKVPNSSGNWSFTTIYNLNYFLANVLPRFGEDLTGAANTISGDLQNIRHYIGEMYFLRAYEYFKRYKAMGDFPIIKEPLADNMQILTDASQRSPRNEVARFILSDLDKAAELMNGINLATTRINRDVALLLKSRVALFEGTWLKYFKGTAFVPNGEGWPGKAKGYNADYQFPSGSIDAEINWFLEQAMSASKEVGDKYKSSLTNNTGLLQQAAGDPVNPYFAMFGQESLSSVKEVLLWRQYVQGLGSGHDIALAADEGNWGVGVTRGYVQNFLMADGTPVYAHGSYADGDGYYMGDKTIADVRINRDSRLSLFLKEPGQKNILTMSVTGLTNIWEDEPYPKITEASGQYLYSTGYALRKGGAWDSKYLVQNKGYTGVIYFRAAEALLNYMEADYERNGTLDATAREYWAALRTRARIAGTIDATIAATDMSKEAENDWGAYSAGQILTDKTLYNIRRERRCELLSEGFRYMDLCRWRAMDQLIATPYIPEGMHLWNTPMEAWYTNLVSDGSNKANVSSKTDSEYLRPLRKRSSILGYDGFTWKMAHYLEPIRIDQFLITAPDGKSIEDSPIYQNPYWPTTADQAAER
ncbi:MAG: RagB/SusD family nutrient uptake outer membrane protein [Prevotellaceae bacterium]|jgi:hypothetical protein|nr:RagB/SusD family nutrient uptake outer membrane protein [Prevotellaceae bacterium]